VDTCALELTVPSDLPLRVLTHGGALTLAKTPTWSPSSNCLWFTVFREPVSRLVSALFYCRLQVNEKGMTSEVDPLCGAEHLDPRTASVREWAAHWGSYLFDELLQHPDLRPDILTQTQSGPHVAPPWYDMKQRLAGGDSIETAAGRANLEKVHNWLDTIDGSTSGPYGIIGLAEEWEETCALLDRGLPLRRGKWADVSETYKNEHGSEVYKDQEEAARDAARSDPVVLKALAADIQLYDHAVRIYKAQLQSATPPASSSVAQPGSSPADLEALPAPSSRVAVIIAADLRVPTEGAAEFFEQFNQQLSGTDVYVCTDREFEPVVRQLKSVVLTTYSEDDGGIPAHLLDSAHPERVRLIQWWRMKTCYGHVEQHAKAMGHEYAYIFKTRTDIKIHNSIMDFYERFVQPSEDSAALRAHIVSDWVFGGQPQVMGILATLYDTWRAYEGATHCKEYYPIDGKILMSSDWDAGVLVCLSYPAYAFDNATSVWARSERIEESVTESSPPKFESNMKALLHADRLSQRDSSSSLLCLCDSKADPNANLPFLSEKSVVLHLLANNVLVQGMDYLRPLLVRYDTPLTGPQKAKLQNPN